MAVTDGKLVRVNGSASGGDQPVETANPLGYADYNDSTTSTTPISVTASTWTDLTNDGAGAYTQKTYLPDDVTDLWNTSTSKFDLSDLPVGELVWVRWDLSVTTSVANQEIQMRFSLAEGAGGAFTVHCDHRYYKTAAAKNVVGLGMFYVGSTDVKNNPGALQIYSADGSLSVVVNGFVIAAGRFQA